MKHLLRFRPVIAQAIVAFLLLTVFGGAVVAISGGGGSLPLPSQFDAALTEQERAYADFVSPRLAVLSDEMAAVTSLVQERSRNVFELNQRGNRITLISAEIIAYGDNHVIPERFARLHEQLRRAADSATSVIANARKALSRFDFGGIPELIPTFERATKEMAEAQLAFAEIVGSNQSG